MTEDREAEVLQAIRMLWREPGIPILDGARPSRFSDGRLFVRCETSGVMQELQGTRATIIDRLNGRIDGAPVRDVYLVLGSRVGT